METTINTMSAISEQTPTVSTSAYTAGDQIGGIQTLTNLMPADSRNERGATLIDITVTESGSVQKAAMNIYIFDELPTLVSVDNGALDITSAELVGKCLGVVEIPADQWFTAKAATNAVASVKNIGLHMKTPAAAQASQGLGTSLFAVVQAVGTPTYVSTTALTFKYKVAQD